MKFTLYNFSKLGETRPSEILVSEFGDIVLMSDDRYLVDGFGIERVEILNEENTLKKILAGFTDDGYRCDHTYKIYLPRDDVASRLIFDFDKLYFDYDENAYSDCENAITYICYLSSLRADLLEGNYTGILDALDLIIEDCGDRSDFIERTTNLKQRIAAFIKDADNEEEGK